MYLPCLGLEWKWKKMMKKKDDEDEEDKTQYVNRKNLYIMCICI